MVENKRIFIGLTEVSGYFGRLKIGLEELGYHVDHFPLQSHRFDYGESDSNKNIFFRFACFCAIIRISNSKSIGIVRLGILILAAFSRLIFFVWALTKYKYFILGAGSSFFAFREFFLFRLLRKKLIYTLHGTDSRPPFMDGAFDPKEYGFVEHEESYGDASTVGLSRALMGVGKRRQARVRKIEHTAIAVVCGGGWGQFLSNRYINFLRIGIPTPANTNTKIEYSASHYGNVPGCKLLHAPSHHRFKGTSEIRKIVAELKEEGLSINYVEISGRPNKEVLAALSSTDILLDQLYSDTPMAALAAEAAVYGVPSIVGGYCTHEEFGCSLNDLPVSAYCHPSEFKSTLRRLIVDESLRKKLGLNARTFVQDNWAPVKVAERFIHIFKGQVPEDYYIDPQGSKYILGAGLSEKKVKENIDLLIKSHGFDGLALDIDNKLKVNLERLLDQVIQE